MTKRQGRPPLPRDTLGLTEPQQLVLHGLLRALSDREISEEYGITAHNVHAHRKEIFKALEVNSRAAVVVKIAELAGVDLETALVRALRRKGSVERPS